MIDEQIEVGDWVLYGEGGRWVLQGKVKAFSTDGKWVKIRREWYVSADWTSAELLISKIAKRKFLRW